MVRVKILQFKHLLFSKKFIAILLIVVSVSSIVFYFNKKDVKPTQVAKSSLPYKEKVGEGVWALKNYDPIKQTFATTKVNTNLVENKNAVKSSIANPSDIDIYRWSVTLPNKTVFAFGQQLKDGIFPAVKVTNKDGIFVKYYPKDFNGFVKPEVKGNVIEWEIASGIKARYIMKEDRVKADYIVDSKDSLCHSEAQTKNLERSFTSVQDDSCSNPKLDFIVEYSKDKEKALISKLMPDGGISFLNKENLQEIFTIPAPIVKDAKGKEIKAEYGLEGNSLGIILSKNGLANATYPVTIDPVVIDASAVATGTSFANGRKILRDAWGNLIAVFDGGTGNDNVYYKNYNAITWTDADIDLDAGAGSAVEISADLDSTGSAHLAFRNTTASAIQYKPLKINRDSSNLITSITTQASFSLDTSTFGARPSIVVANKGGGAGVEKIAVAYGMNSTGAGRGEIRFMQCDVADNCASAANWKNASEEINGSGTCSDTVTSGAAGLPNSATCKGTTDKLFNVAANTIHHVVLTQIPGKPKRTPLSAKKFDGTSYTNLTAALDDNTGTTSDLSSLDSTDDYLYIGDNNLFSNFIVDITNTNTTVGAAWGTKQYCSAVDGSNNCITWTTLSADVDYSDISGPSAFGTDGSIIFDESVDWIKSTVDGDNRYWLRLKPSGTFDTSVSVAEFDVTDRNSKALLVVGGVDSTDDLGAAYVVWNFVNNDRWEDKPSTGPSLPWTTSSLALDTLGGNWTTFTNFPLTLTMDNINQAVYVSYVEDLATDVLHVKKISKNKNLNVAANWADTSFPTVTEAADIALSLTADGSDIYLFHVLDPGTNSLVFRKCVPSGGGDGNICDNSADWGSEKTLDNSTDVSHPQAVVTKVTGDTVAIDTIYTMPTALDIVYERHYVDLADKTVVVAASADDAYHVDCDTPSTNDDQVITGNLNLGREDGFDIELGCGLNADASYHAGFRFPSVTVSQGAVISSAYVDFRIAVRSGSSPINFTVYGNDIDNGSSFQAYTNGCDSAVLGKECVNNRIKTTSNSVQEIDFQTNTYRIDVTDIVQEIICRGAANSQPCVGNFNKSGNWVSGNAIVLLLISTEGGTVSNFSQIVSQDDTGNALEPTLQINLAPSGTTGKSYSLGSATQLATDSASFADLDHPFSSTEFSSVLSDDTNYASVSATTNYASSSAQPAFMFKVNNSNNDNTYKIDAQSIVKSTLPTSSKPIYLQVYRGGGTSDWVTMASNNNTVADTDITLTSSQITSNLSEYYFNETPGIGTRYAACTNGTANCWTYWRLYQDSVGTDQNVVLSLDYVNISFTSSAPEVPSAKLKGGVNIRGGSKIK